MNGVGKNFSELNDQQKDEVAGMFLNGPLDSSSFFESLLTNRGLIELGDGTTTVLRKKDTKEVLARRARINGVVEVEK